MERIAKSPLAIYQSHLDKGELAYQWSPEAQRAVFYPRLICPTPAATASNGGSPRGSARSMRRP